MRDINTPNTSASPELKHDPPIYLWLLASIFMATVMWCMLDGAFTGNESPPVTMFQSVFALMFAASVLSSIMACLRLLRAELRFHRQQTALQHTIPPDNSD